MQLETLAFTASTHLAAATTTKTTSSPSPRLPPPPLAIKRTRQNLGATNRSSANLFDEFVKGLRAARGAGAAVAPPFCAGGDGGALVARALPVTCD